MLVSSPAIVLGSIKYGETSVICRMYTAHHGTLSFIVNGVRSNKAKFAPGLFEPLTIVTISCSLNPKSELHRIKEIYCDQPYHNIPLNPGKRIIRYFLAEVLAQLLLEERENHALYDYLNAALHVLDLMDQPLGTYPIQFMMQLCQFFGLSPTSADDFLDHLAHPANEMHGLLPVEQAEVCIKLMQTPLSSYHPNLSPELRRYLLQLVLDYWSGHLNYILAPKTLPVLASL